MRKAKTVIAEYPEMNYYHVEHANKYCIVTNQTF